MGDSTYKRRQAAEQCTNCGGPRDTKERQVCSGCAPKLAARTKRYAALKHKRGRCRCSNIAEPGKRRCMTCLRRDNRKRRKRIRLAKLHSKCHFGCGRPRAPNRKTCTYHLEWRREQDRRLRSERNAA